MLATVTLAAGAHALAVAGPGWLDERADRLAEVESWPSPAGTRFVERYSHDGEALGWMIEVLRLGEFEAGEVTAPRRAVLLATLRKAPWRGVRNVIRASAAPGAPVDAVVNGIRLLGALGDAADVGYIVELVTSVDGGAGSEVLGAFEQALASILATDSRAVHLVGDLFDERYRALWSHVAGGVGRSGRAEALGHLARLLNRDSQLDALLLTQMGVLGEQANPTAVWDVCLSVRGFLMDERPTVRREAALALGKLRDSDSVDALLGLLEDSSRGVRASVLWALREISGQDLGDDIERWRFWYREELAWWTEEYPGLLAAIHRGEAVEVGPAISALTTKRLFRHRMAADLSVLVSHAAPEVRRRACVALRELGSLAASTELVAALRDPDEDVRREAHAALRATSGLDLPPDPEAWHQALGLGW